MQQDAYIKYCAMITLMIMHALVANAEADLNPDSGRKLGGDHSSSSPA
jgi:hypothetical protein